MVRTWGFHCQRPGSIPGRRTNILQATQCGQEKVVFNNINDIYTIDFVYLLLFY